MARDTMTDLANAMLQLKSVAQVRGFLQDMLSEREVENLTSRWQIILAITQNPDNPYAEIARGLGCNERRVARAQKQIFEEGSGVARKLARKTAERQAGR